MFAPEKWSAGGKCTRRGTAVDLVLVQEDRLGVEFGVTCRVQSVDRSVPARLLTISIASVIDGSSTTHHLRLLSHHGLSAHRVGDSDLIGLTLTARTVRLCMGQMRAFFVRWNPQQSGRSLRFWS